MFDILFVWTFNMKIKYKEKFSKKESKVSLCFIYNTRRENIINDNTKKKNRLHNVVMLLFVSSFVLFATYGVSAFNINEHWTA